MAAVTQQPGSFEQFPFSTQVPLCQRCMENVVKMFKHCGRPITGVNEIARLFENV